MQSAQLLAEKIKAL